MKSVPSTASGIRRRLSPTGLLMAALFAVCPPGVMAEGGADEVSRAQLLQIIQRLEQRVEQLERQQATPAAAASPADVQAQQQKQQQLEQQIATQQAQIEALADAQEAGGSSWADRTSLAGYGELHYNHLEAESSANDLDQIDFHRFVLFIGHEFNEDIRLFTELEVEHALAGESKPGEVELEQAYIEFDLFSDQAAARAGLFLLPVGILNETHEPNTFYGVERNDVESIIIPSTWWAGGAGYTHRFNNGLQWDIALHEGLAMPTTGGSAFRIRSGRQKTAEASSEDLAVTGRLKYTGIPGVEVAGSISHQKDPSQASGDGLDRGTLYEAHVALQRGPFGLRALYAKWDLDINESIALANGVAQTTLDRADDQQGWYIEPSWKFVDEFGIYARYEDIESAREQDNFDQWEAGFNYWPHPNVVLKADYRVRDHDIATSRDRDFDGFDLGVGYQF